MNNKYIKKMSTAELINKNKREYKLFLEYWKLFWLVVVGGLVIYPILLALADFSKLPPVIADVFGILWFGATIVLLFVYTHYQRVSNLDHNELAKRR